MARAATAAAEEGRGVERRHLGGAGGAGQLRGGVADDDEQDARRGQARPADEASLRAGIAVRELVRRGGAQQGGQRRGDVVLPRPGVGRDARRDGRGRPGGGEVDPGDGLPAELIGGHQQPGRGMGRGRRRRRLVVGPGRPRARLPGLRAARGVQPGVPVVLRVHRVDAGHGDQQQADAEAGRDREDHQPDEGLLPAADRQPQAQPEHPRAPAGAPGRGPAAGRPERPVRAHPLPWPK